MDHDALMRARGEQVTLERELRELDGQLGGEKQAVLALVNRLSAGTLAPGWADAECARLRRIAECFERRADLERRIRELKKVTGF